LSSNLFAEGTPSRHSLSVGTTLWSDHGSATGDYGVVPHEGKPYPNDPLGHQIEFEGERTQSVHILYSYQIHRNFAIQASIGRSTVKFTGKQNGYLSEFQEQYYRYWDGEWDEPTLASYTFDNPRQPSLSFNEWIGSAGLHYFRTIHQLEIQLGVNAIYTHAYQGRYQDWLFVKSGRGSRGLMFHSMGLLEGRVQDHHRLGASLDLRMSYPLTKGFSIYTFASIEGYPDKSANIETGSLNEIEGASLSYLFDHDASRLSELTEMKSVSFNGLRYSAGAGIKYRF
jgi:hypothetical protein